jgi:hypothetical protein
VNASLLLTSRNDIKMRPAPAKEDGIAGGGPKIGLQDARTIGIFPFTSRTNTFAFWEAPLSSRWVQMNAVEIEEAVSNLAEAPFDAKAFPYAFLEAFGNKETTLKRLKSGNTN